MKPTDIAPLGSPHPQRLRLAVLGSTGSIGVSTLDVAARHPERFRIAALTAQSNVPLMLDQCLKHAPEIAVLVDNVAALQLRRALAAAGSKTEVLAGAEALCLAAAHERVDCVMAAIVGAAGLPPSLAAARAGKRLLLANKEALVMSGPLFMQTVRDSGATLIPIDSEHNAIFQCMPPGSTAGLRCEGVSKILLTASGGPFLRASAASMAVATPAQACAHPRWVMGRKISVDSATLLNKGLELIEACLLFAVPPEAVQVLIHPQSVVHSLVEYLDGSMLAQLGNPDMRTPIAHALGWPERLHSGVESLDLVKVGRLDFEPPDLNRFPCLRLAREAAVAGGTAPAVLNAANEVAVQAFLDGRCAFPSISQVIDEVLSLHQVAAVRSLGDVLEADAWARASAMACLAGSTGACA